MRFDVSLFQKLSRSHFLQFGPLKESKLQLVQVARTVQLAPESEKKRTHWKKEFLLSFEYCRGHLLGKSFARFSMRITLKVVLIHLLVCGVCVPGRLRSGSEDGRQDGITSLKCSSPSY